jgi:hypothetical protein
MIVRDGTVNVAPAATPASTNVDTASKVQVNFSSTVTDRRSGGMADGLGGSLSIQLPVPGSPPH